MNMDAMTKRSNESPFYREKTRNPETGQAERF